MILACEELAQKPQNNNENEKQKMSLDSTTVSRESKNHAKVLVFTRCYGCCIGKRFEGKGKFPNTPAVTRQKHF